MFVPDALISSDGGLVSYPFFSSLSSILAPPYSSLLGSPLSFIVSPSSFVLPPPCHLCTLPSFFLSSLLCSLFSGVPLPSTLYFHLSSSFFSLPYYLRLLPPLYFIILSLLPPYALPPTSPLSLFVFLPPLSLLLRASSIFCLFL
jgi:hypothetical protein